MKEEGYQEVLLLVFVYRWWWQPQGTVIRISRRRLRRRVVKGEGKESAIEGGNEGESEIGRGRWGEASVELT